VAFKSGDALALALAWLNSGPQPGAAGIAECNWELRYTTGE
jgi:hypothetical protein